MSDIDDIYQALTTGRLAAESLSWWQRSADGSAACRAYISEIDRAIVACDRLRCDLRDGRKHIDLPDDFKRTCCGCGDPGASPPCSWCTREVDEGDEG